MQLRYDEDFVEACVFVCASGRRQDVPSLQISRFHRERERLYRILDPDQRNAAFFKLQVDWFREWGLERVLTDTLSEFPFLPEKLALLAVRQVRSKHDQGAELYVNDAGQRTGILALRPESLALDRAVRDYLRHEFMHLNDMLDPAFGYSPALDLPGFNAAQRRIARERYRLLWDITIDGRLTAAGHQPMLAREQHAAAFARGYSFWAEEKQALEFDLLWQGQAPCHSAFLALIADPRGLLNSHGPAPGGSCPLCDFPTFVWAPPERLLATMIDRIQFEFPQWQARDGLCGRCLETYEAAAKYTPAHSLACGGTAR